jgi:hypothetical protein
MYVLRRSVQGTTTPRPVALLAASTFRPFGRLAAAPSVYEPPAHRRQHRQAGGFAL